MNTCTNCGSEITGKYCSECGQEVISGRLSINHIVKDAFHGILHWEHSILKTFKELIVHPGYTIKFYIEGKRKSYVKPFSYFIFLQTAYVLVFHWLSDKYFAFVTATVTVNGTMTETQLSKFEEIKHAVTTNINYYNYAFPLIFAWFWMLFLKKKTGINYAESAVSGFYLIGTSLFFGIIFMMLTMLHPKFWEARFFLTYIYFTIALIQFSGISVIKGALRTLAVTILSYLSYTIFVSILTIFYLYVFKGIRL